MRLQHLARIQNPIGEPSSPAYSAWSDWLPCDLQPVTPAAAFEQWGIELAEPYRLFGRVGDWESATVNARVQVDGKMFAIRATPRTWRGRNELTAVNHAVVLLERIRGAE